MNLLSIRDVKFELNVDEGYFILYLRVGENEVHASCEVTEGIVADVDREGRPVALEVVKTFPPEKKPGQVPTARIILDDVNAAIEKRFGVTLPDEEFQKVRAMPQLIA